MLDSRQIEGQWPTHRRFVMAGGDSIFVERYGPRWARSWGRHWQLPLHLHLVDPTDHALEQARSLAGTVTWNRLDPEWTRGEIEHFAHRTQRQDRPDQARDIWLVGIYQVARFWVTGHLIGPEQQVIMTDLDACATQPPNPEWLQDLYRQTGFQKYKNRLMATFGCASGAQRHQWREYSRRLEEMLANGQGNHSMDQLLLRTVFSTAINRLQHQWCCHQDLADQTVEQRWQLFPVFHLKGTRGKKVDISGLI